MTGRVMGRVMGMVMGRVEKYSNIYFPFITFSTRYCIFH